MISDKQFIDAGEKEDHILKAKAKDTAANLYFLRKFFYDRNETKYMIMADDLLQRIEEI